MTGRLDGKIAAVTGAASGFGAAIAARFVEEGATVVLLDRDPNVEVVAGSLGPNASAMMLDVVDEVAFQTVLDQTAQRCGRLDVLVNNAGIIGGGWIEEPDAAVHLRRNLDVNVVGVWNGCRAAIPLMRNGGGGSIVNTGSIAAVQPTPGAPAYGMAKAAMVHLTRSLAIGYGPDGIRVNAMLPGPAATGIFRDTGLQPDELEERYRDNIALGRMAQPSDIAAAMVYLASDEASFVTGAVLNVDGGFQQRRVTRP